MKFLNWILTFLGFIKPTIQSQNEPEHNPQPLPRIKYSPEPGEYYVIYATGNLPDHGEVIEMPIDFCKTQSQAQQICHIWRALVPDCRFSWDFDDQRQVQDLAEHLLQTDIQSSGDNGLLLVSKHPKVKIHKIWIGSLQDEKCPEWIKEIYIEEATKLVQNS